MTPLTLAVQKDGRLSDDSLAFLRECGLAVRPGPRSLTAACDGFPLELLFLRAKDIPEVVADGGADLGLCGQDVLAEHGDDALRTLAPLGFGRCRLAIAAPTTRPLDGARIATSFPRTLGRWLDETGVRAEVVTLSGSVEVAPRLGIADAVCDLVSTGSTLAQNGLRELETVLRSEAVLFANGLEDAGKRATLDALLLRVRARLAAKETRYVVMNAPESAVPALRALLPGLKTPTISRLAEPGWVSIATVVGVDVFWETMQALKDAGASDVLVLPIEQLVR